MSTAARIVSAALPQQVSIEIVDALSAADLHDLCEAADAAIVAGGGFGWVDPPPRDVMERYWRGVMVVPERHLIVARAEGVIVGAIQLVEPSRHNEAQSFTAALLASFVAPYARQIGAGRKLVETAERLALEMGYRVLTLDVRETQTTAIHLVEAMGYLRWGVNPHYACVRGVMVSGYYYSKTIVPLKEGAKTLPFPIK